MMSLHSVTARSGSVAAVISMLAITSLVGAGAAAPPVSASLSSPAPAASSPAPAAVKHLASQGDTTCAHWPHPTSPGLQCTGTYSGSKAWNPWTWSSIPEEPVVTVSQATNLTDQGVQVTWHDFTPSLSNGSDTPNPTTLNPLYQVSIFECEGTNPDISAFESPTSTQCYMPGVGSTTTQANSGPANGLLENTLDTSPLPANPSIYASYPDKSSWNGGDPSTWTGQADFHVEAPTPKSKGGFFNCGPRTPCSLVVVPDWGGTPVHTRTGQFSWTNTKLCGQHWLGGGEDPKKPNPSKLGNPKPNPMGPFGQGDIVGSAGSPPYAESTVPTSGSSGAVAALQGASYACWAANRIVIPLSFAPTPNNCPNRAPAFYAEGSPMMQTQMLQWQAGWCNGRAPVALTYTSNSESQARADFLASGQIGGARTNMALVTLPASATEQQASHRRFTYAPLANSGTGIAYEADDPVTGSQVNRMVLDARLLAKLTTQSYSLQYNCSIPPQSPWPPLPNASDNCDPAVVSIFGGTVVRSNPQSLFDDPEFLSLNKQCQPYGQLASYTCGAGDFPPDSAATDVPIGGFLPTVLEPESDMTYDMTSWMAADHDAAAFLNGGADPWGMQVNSNYLHIPYPAQAFSQLDNGVGYPHGLPRCQLNCINDINQQDETMQASWNFAIDLKTIITDLLTDQPTSVSPTVSCPLLLTGCNSTTELNPTSSVAPLYLGSRALLSELDLGEIAGYLLPAAELVNAAGKTVGPTQAGVEAAVSAMKTNPDKITQYFPFTSTNPAAYPLTMVDYAMVPTCGLSSSTASAIADFLTKAATTGQTQGEAPGQLAPGYYPLTAKQKAQTLTAAREVKAQTCKSPPPDHTVGGHHSNGSGGTTPHSSGKTPAGSHPSPTNSIGPARTAAYGQKSADSGLTGVLLVLAIILGALLVLGGPAAWVITVTDRWPVVNRWVRMIPGRLQTLAGTVIRRA